MKRTSRPNYKLDMKVRYYLPILKKLKILSEKVYQLFTNTFEYFHKLLFPERQN